MSVWAFYFKVQGGIKMAKGGSGGSKGGGSGKSRGGGRPAPIPPNNGPNPAGWPSRQTGNQSGGGRNNGPAKK
jgi:hypothetical protein